MSLHRLPYLDTKTRRRVVTFVRTQPEGRIEIVPSGGVVFAIVSDPGGSLELYWLSDAGPFRLRDVIRSRGIPASAASVLGRRLQICHAEHASAPRRLVPLATRPVAAVLSEDYGSALRRIVSEVLA